MLSLIIKMELIYNGKDLLWLEDLLLYTEDIFIQ